MSKKRKRHRKDLPRVRHPAAHDAKLVDRDKQSLRPAAVPYAAHPCRFDIITKKQPAKAVFLFVIFISGRCALRAVLCDIPV